MIRSKSERAFEWVCIAVATLLLIACLYPLLYTFFVSLCSEAEWTERQGLLLFLPSRPTFAAYGKIFGVGSYVLKSLFMSLARTLVGTVISLALTAILGYALTIDFPGKKQYIYFLLFTIFFSGGLIPNYLVIKQIGLVNNFWSLILPNLINAWNALVFKQFFSGIPKEIQEAARIDGAGEFRLFWNIMLPLSKPVIASIGLFTMVFHWNSWFDVMIYIDQSHSALWTLQYYIMINYNNLSQIDSTKLPNLATDGVSQQAVRMALTIMGLVPILCIYPFFQKFLKDGVYTGAVKG